MAISRQRPSRWATWALTSSVLFSAATAVGFDCKKVMDQGIHWDLGKLIGPHSTSWVYQLKGQPQQYNFTFTVDLCQPLKNKDDDNHQCPTGTRVCGVNRMHEGDAPPTQLKWVAIAGDFKTTTGTPIEVHPKRLKTLDADNPREGVRLEMLGGQDPFEYDKKGPKQIKQKAIIELICDKSKSGWEPGAEPNEKLEERAVLGRREDEGKNSSSLTFQSYELTPINGVEWQVLKLEWATKYACEDATAQEGSSSSGRWGFFTWFILILFLAISAYVIFGSWLNYTRYGARGWDLIPHGDTIRDIPYIIKDALRRFQGGGSRGGYSAV